jgi:hypothetical protein
MTGRTPSLEDLGNSVRERVLRSGVLAPQIRAPALRIGGDPDSAERIPEPQDALVRQIGRASHRVTDAQVDAVRSATGTDRATFELVLAASIGAGLARWDAAIGAIERASDAPG